MTFAAKIRVYLLDHPVPDETRLRMQNAALLLETGHAREQFDGLGKPTLAALKKRYIAHVVAREPSIRAAAKVLDCDPATIWRAQNNGPQIPSGARTTAAKSPPGNSFSHNK